MIHLYSTEDWLQKTRDVNPRPVLDSGSPHRFNDWVGGSLEGLGKKIIRPTVIIIDLEALPIPPVFAGGIIALVENEHAAVFVNRIAVDSDPRLRELFSHKLDQVELQTLNAIAPIRNLEI